MYQCCIRQPNIELAGSEGHDDNNENVKDLENNWPGGAKRLISNTEKHEASAPLTQTSKVKVSLKDSLEEDKDESFVSSLKESSKKRHCSGTDTDSYNTLQDNTAELQLMLHTLKDDIVSEVTGIFNKAKISATASAEKSHSEVYDVVESVHKSENIEELKM